MLPSKTIPEASGHKSCTKAKGKQAASRPSKKKVRRAPVEMEEIEDEDSARNIAARKAVNKVGVSLQDKRKVCCLRLLMRTVRLDGDGRLPNGWGTGKVQTSTVPSVISWGSQRGRDGDGDGRHTGDGCRRL